MAANPRFTLLEVAEKLDLDREVVRGFVKFLMVLELAELKGERKSETGRGKPENVYAFIDDFEKVLARTLKRANLT